MGQHEGNETTRLTVNGRDREVYAELMLLDPRGEGLILLLTEDERDEETVFVAVATVVRPDLALRVQDETGEAPPLDGFRYAAETFAVMPAAVASGIIRPDLLESLAGMDDCPECQRERDEAGGEERPE